MKKLAYSVQEAAGLIGVSKTHLHRMVNEGVIRSVPLGHRKLIPVDALEAFIAGRKLGESAEKEVERGDE